MDVTHHLAAQVGEALKERSARLVVAESCTGGWVGEIITSVPGSSAWFDRGYITYSDAAKQQDLGVSAATLTAQGAVSEAVVREMAEGALARAAAQVSVAVSGIAGPDGGTPDKPVGTVWLAWARAGGDTRAELSNFEGDREMIRKQAVLAALQGVLDMVEGRG
ncbi:MAG: nicotinamide-nucleotide amidohydrolase family protein [Gammaproteobacteria bacterium]|nr:nicotinamide-nucleotide amidohydrolase family protein [Gammaproteobacteria bacterium]